MGGTIFSSDPDPKGGSNLKALWRSHLTSVRWPISYRIRFMARRSFLFYFCFLPLRRGEGHALCGKFHYCQKIGTTTGVVVGLRSGSRLTTTIVDLYFHDFYRIHFMARRSFFVFFIKIPLFFFEPFPKSHFYDIRSIFKPWLTYFCKIFEKLRKCKP